MSYFISFLNLWFFRYFILIGRQFAAISVFFRFIINIQGGGLIEVFSYIKKASSILPILLFAFSRNYGYAKASILNFSGTRQFHYQILVYLKKQKYFFIRLGKFLIHHFNFIADCFYQTYICFNFIAVFFKVFRKFFFFFKFLNKFNYFKFEFFIKSNKIWYLLVNFFKFQLMIFDLISFFYESRVDFFESSFWMQKTLWLLLAILARQKDITNIMLDYASPAHFDFGYGGFSFNHFLRRTQFVYNKFVTYHLRVDGKLINIWLPYQMRFFYYIESLLNIFSNSTKDFKSTFLCQVKIYKKPKITNILNLSKQSILDLETEIPIFLNIGESENYTNDISFLFYYEIQYFKDYTDTDFNFYQNNDSLFKDEYVYRNNIWV